MDMRLIPVQVEVHNAYSRGGIPLTVHAIANVKCDKNAGLRGLVGDWFRLTQRIYIWDYVVNFRQYLLPEPGEQVVLARSGPLPAEIGPRPAVDRAS